MKWSFWNFAKYILENETDLCSYQPMIKRYAENFHFKIASWKIKKALNIKGLKFKTAGQDYSSSDNELASYLCLLLVKLILVTEMAFSEHRLHARPCEVLSIAGHLCEGEPLRTHGRPRRSSFKAYASNPWCTFPNRPPLLKRQRFNHELQFFFQTRTWESSRH